MNGITEQPPVYDFGLDFNYANWPKGTVVTLTNVPWNNDYRDIVKFADRAALNNYIDSLENVVVDTMSYIRPNENVRIDIPFNAAYKYNYLRVSNPLQPIPNDVRRDFYYFITDVQYIAPNTTQLVVQLDVWQTFGFDVTFGNSYIERGHIGIANQKAFQNYGRDYLTVPEGIDIGGEYLQVNRRTDKVIHPDNMYILVVSTVDLFADPVDVDGFPKLTTAEGTVVQGLPQGSDFYVFKHRDYFKSFMEDLADKPWISQGIVSITAIPQIDARYGYTLMARSGHPNVYRFDDDEVSKGKYTELFENWRESTQWDAVIPERYRRLKKLFTYPYMVLELTTWGATPIILKPESWNDPDAKIVEKAVFAPPNQRVLFYPSKYNARATAPTAMIGDETFDDGGDYLDAATQINNFPSFTVVNNMAIGYLAANTHGIAFQRQSADWSQQRALQSNQVSYDQQSAGIEMAKNINALSRAGMGAMTSSDQLALLQSTAANGLAGVIGGTGGMLMGGALGGMAGAAGAGAGGVLGGVQQQIMGGINAGISVDASNRSTAIQQNVSKGTNVAQTNQAALMRDTNKSLADWAAKGDYENNIAAINAKVQDAALIQPSSSGQMGGEAFNLIHNAGEVSLRWKLIDPAAMRVVCEYWLRYGYAVRQFGRIPASLMVMEKFTYWKLSETYITAAGMPEFFKQSIRGIFEKGVTVWTNPDYIGAIDIADNAPLGGVTL